MATSKNAQTLDHSAAIAKYASAKNIDTTTAGKRFRAKLRSSFDVIAENDPQQYGAKGTCKTHANDKRPWGAHKVTTLDALFPNVFSAK